jgi:hypothetical protein
MGQGVVAQPGVWRRWNAMGVACAHIHVPARVSGLKLRVHVRVFTMARELGAGHAPRPNVDLELEEKCCWHLVVQGHLPTPVGQEGTLVGRIPPRAVDHHPRGQPCKHPPTHTSGTRISCMPAACSRIQRFRRPYRV